MPGVGAFSRAGCDVSQGRNEELRPYIVEY